MKKEIEAMGMLLESEDIRSLFYNFCREVINFSADISISTTLFEARFRSRGGMDIKVSVYRELFIVAAGSGGAVNVRVIDRQGLIKALDIALGHYLRRLTKVQS